MEKMETGGEPRVITPSRRYFIVGTLLLILGVVALIVWCAWGNPKTISGIPNSYGVVFDAGSTGTRLHVYSWPGGKVNGTGLVRETAECSDGEALSSFETHPSDAGSALEVCLNKTHIPQKQETRVFLGATAGMRLVHERNSTISDAIFWWVREFLRNTMLEFANDNDARIIDGSEEGISGWIMVNYVIETLEESPKSLARYVRSLYTTIEPKTIGALDLGGASMQISFIPYQAEKITHDSVHKLRLYGVNYNVYSQSYLCYGTVEAKRMYVAQLIEDAGFKEVIFDPCGNEGFNETVTQEYVWSPPCTNRPKDVDIPLNFTLVGKGNGEECRRQALNLITADSIPCTHQSCGINGVFQPPCYGEFMAFSGFYYTTSGIGLGENASMSELNQTALNFCDRTWREVKEIDKEKYVKTYCFNANYIYAVLVNGFKFTDDSWNIRFVGKVKGVSVSWALGYMLNTTNMIPAEAPETDTLVPSSAFVVVAVLFAVTAVIGLCLIIYHLRKRG